MEMLLSSIFSLSFKGGLKLLTALLKIKLAVVWTLLSSIHSQLGVEYHQSHLISKEMNKKHLRSSLDKVVLPWQTGYSKVKYSKNSCQLTWITKLNGNTMAYSSLSCCYIGLFVSIGLSFQVFFLIEIYFHAYQILVNKWV